jgi:hypothetical protein
MKKERKGEGLGKKREVEGRRTRNEERRGREKDSE